MQEITSTTRDDDFKVDVEMDVRQKTHGNIHIKDNNSKKPKPPTKNDKLPNVLTDSNVITLPLQVNCYRKVKFNGA